MATNQIRQLDSAVLDRMNELVEIPLPGHPERTQMLNHYLMHHVFGPANDDKQRVKLSDDLVTTINESGIMSLASEIADMTDGMSGREIEKMCSNIYVSHSFLFLLKHYRGALNVVNLRKLRNRFLNVLTF